MRSLTRLLLIALALATAGCGAGYTSTSARSGGGAAATASTTPPKVHRLASGLVYEDLVMGQGTMADPGLTATVHYTGWLADGTKFDSSLDSGRPLSFQLGAGRVIAGWEQGVKGMRVGGKRKLTVPPDLAYGARGAGGVIPPNATLLFEVELLDVK
jgi:FKBP-type peptidyl-prolyl cis-trans isomerase